MSKAAKTNDSGTAQVRVLAVKEGGKQVEEGMRSRGGAVPKQSKLWKISQCNKKGTCRVG